MRKLQWTIAATLLSVGVATAGEDKTAADYQRAFEAWAGKVAELQQADTAGVATQELETIRSLVGQGQAFVANDKLEAAEPLLTRVEVLNELAVARLVRTAAERDALDADGRAAKAEADSTAAKTAAETAEARKRELEAQGL